MTENKNNDYKIKYFLEKIRFLKREQVFGLGAIVLGIFLVIKNLSLTPIIIIMLVNLLVFIRIIKQHKEIKKIRKQIEEEEKKSG